MNPFSCSLPPVDSLAWTRCQLTRCNALIFYHSLSGRPLVRGRLLILITGVVRSSLFYPFVMPDLPSPVQRPPQVQENVRT
jgi:hypothetical protein